MWPVWFGQGEAWLDGGLAGGLGPRIAQLRHGRILCVTSLDRVSIPLRHGLTQRVVILDADRNWVRTMHDEQILGCDVPDENEVRFLTEILDDLRRFVDEIWRF